MADAEFVREMQESNKRLTNLLLQLHELRRHKLPDEIKFDRELDKDLEEGRMGGNSRDWTK
jgi:hypothetical protein